MKKTIYYSLIMLFMAFTFSCKKDGNTHTVKYTIQGTSKSNITYSDANGNIQSANNVDASWTYGFSSGNHGLALKLTVVSSDGSPVGGKIYIDGQQSAQDNGTGGSITITSVLP
ncbi:MAG: hypothetical protein NVSMB24_32730 [Mucilaginibacter sp.]